MTRTWLPTKLGEVCSLRGGSAFSKDLQGRDSGELPFIKVSDFEHPENSYRIVSANNWITVKDAKSIRAKPHPAGATVFAKIGIALLSNRRRLLVRDTLIDNNLMSASPRNSVDSKFLFYLLRTLDFGSHAGGSALPYLTAKDLNAIAIEVPQPPEQRAIAGVLGSLDDKIEHNRRTARTLERLARAIFRAWFVDFEPVKAKAEGATSFPSMPQEVFDVLPTRFVDSDIGPVPEGWEVKAIGGIMNIRDGKPIKKEDRQAGPYPVFGANGVIGYSAVALTKEPSIILGKIGTCGSLHRTESGAWISNNAFSVTAGPSGSLEFAWHTLSMIDFSGFVGGSANPYMPKKNWAHLPVLFPPEELRLAFEMGVRPMRDLTANNDGESEALAAMRDYLLPKLLSGDVRVEAAHG